MVPTPQRLCVQRWLDDKEHDHQQGYQPMPLNAPPTALTSKQNKPAPTIPPQQPSQQSTPGASVTPLNPWQLRLSRGRPNITQTRGKRRETASGGQLFADQLILSSSPFFSVVFLPFLLVRATCVRFAFQRHPRDPGNLHVRLLSIPQVLLFDFFYFLSHPAFAVSLVNFGLLSALLSSSHFSHWYSITTKESTIGVLRIGKNP
ncbi:hypothetical protein BJ322DRAFT_143970 [Thelephora terrestris]|uniref:Uncharacterized protein n=1 Tax=Thelephora terrestris TaxID=56493 RepID=A0A9P6L4T0_9AGAM|nr:hypothetical protein BJ322DRAFT_143970 [Thelephora terrestris]